MESHSARIAVAVATRDRPLAVSALLRTLVGLGRPSGCSLLVVLVENASEPSLGAEVGALRCDLPPGVELLHLHEPRLGIPFARNRALRAALDGRCAFLGFLDDDVVPAPDWLLRIHEALLSQQADLVGGPVRFERPEAPLGPLKSAVWRGLRARFRRVELGAASRHASGDGGAVTAITANWFARLDFIRRHGLVFDESLGTSGGSDVVFWRTLRRCGGRTGWAPKAFVHETWPPERLTPSYQFKRGRDQSITYYRIRHPRSTPLSVLLSVFYVLAKSLASLLLGLLAPFGGLTLAASFRSAGMAWGRLCALAGRRSAHYA